MTRTPLPQFVRRALARGAVADVPDAELLRRFAVGRDADAFAELVERYAPLVWGACRRVLGTGSTAEDAFQTTFVTLARKAGGLRHPERLPGWLYGVARRAAWQHRESSRTTAGPVPDRPAPAPSPLDQVSGRELIAAIEAEVDRLPDAYRSAVVLCWFQDSSLDDAARQLGTSRDALWGWLKRARERLQRRLAARGFGLPAIVGATILAAGPVSARLIGRTVESALRPAAPAAAVPVGSILSAKKLGAAVLVAASFAGIATVLPGGGPESPAKDPSKQSPVPKAEEIYPTHADGFKLPTGAIHQFGNRQLRHPDGIGGSMISPDGKYLATLGSRTVIVWDLGTLAAKLIIRDPRILNYGMDVGAGQLAFLPDGKSIAATARPNHTTGLRPGVEKAVMDLAVVFDLETGKERFTLKGNANYEVAVWVSAGGKELATFGGGSARFYDIKDGKELLAVPLKDAEYTRPWIAPDADRVAVQSIVAGTQGVTLFDARTGKEVYSLPGVEVVQVGLRRDGKMMVVHDGTGKIRVHDPDAQKEVLAFDHPAARQMGPMRFSKDGNTLYFGGQHGQLFRWDLKNNKRLPDVGRHTTWTLSSIALSPDESVLYSMGYNKVVHRWDLKGNKQLPTPEGYVTQTAVAPAPDGKHLIVVDHAGHLDSWDLATGRHVKQYQTGKSGGFDCVAISADGRWLAGGRTVQDVQLWDFAAGKVERVIPLVEKPDPRGSDHVKRVAFRADGKVLFTGSNKTGITAWEVPSGKKLWNVPGIGPLAAVDPRGRWVVAGGKYNRESNPWTALDMATGEVVRQVEVEPEQDAIQETRTIAYPPYLSDIAFTPDGSRLVTCHFDGTIRVWDPEAGKELLRMKGNGYGSAGLALSGDGKWAAVGGVSYKVNVWELATGKQVLALGGHDSQVRDVAFTRDGRGLVANADLAPTLWALTPKDLPAVDGPADPLWEALATDDGAKVFPLEWAFANNPKVAVKIFGERVHPAEQAMERSRFDKLAGDLDSPRFAVREVSEKELTKAGYRVPVAWLRAARAAAKSDEVRARLDRVLAVREKPNAEERRLSRAVQVLE
ncbi:MAG TPA: sigma-70 family RNA polymerase sigma factor, partial [Gemmataceae bacterium]|nr:sigma-70 family RNA polymerase sigma factor [Gemmataceae bacterium]